MFMARTLWAREPTASALGDRSRLVTRGLLATFMGVREMGYECVGFWSPYFDWTPERGRIFVFVVTALWAAGLPKRYSGAKG